MQTTGVKWWNWLKIVNFINFHYQLPNVNIVQPQKFKTFLKNKSFSTHCHIPIKNYQLRKESQHPIYFCKMFKSLLIQEHERRPNNMVYVSAVWMAIIKPQTANHVLIQIVAKHIIHYCIMLNVIKTVWKNKFLSEVTNPQKQCYNNQYHPHQMSDVNWLPLLFF